MNFVCLQGSCLSQSILKGGILLQRTFLKAGANVTTTYPGGSNCLFPAVRKGNVDCLNTLLQLGADVNASSYEQGSALVEAAKWNRLQCLQVLIQHGAIISKVDSRGFTALIAAADNGNAECVRLLLDAGADVNHMAHGYVSSALLCATRNGHYNCVEILRDAGAHVNTRDRFGQTSLMYASLQKPPLAMRDIRLLLRLGAHVNVTHNHRNCVELYLVHKYYYTCYTNAQEKRDFNPDVLNLLLGAGEILNLLPTVSSIPVHIPLFLCDNEFRFRLKHLCREAIRAHLIDIDRYTHLFGRIPRLGLPSLLSQYLLYHSSLD